MKIQSVLVISGYSGAGKTYLLKFLETIGYYSIDNVALPVVQDLLDLYEKKTSSIHKLAISVDTRGSLDFSLAGTLVEHLKKHGFNYKIIFLVAQDDILVSRFQQTRMSHPLSFREEYKQLGLLELIKIEKNLLSAMRDNADLIVDTSRTTVHDLRKKIVKIVQEGVDNFWIRIVSFGFSKGIPQDVDLVFDLRFLPNPYFVDGLAELSGLDQEVREYVLSDELASNYLNKIKESLNLIIPRYKLMKNYISIAFGCTGGRHRSVSFAVLLSEYFKKQKYSVTTEHRDLGDAI